MIDALLPGRRHDRRWGTLLSAALDGELSPAEERLLHAHLEGCDRCRTRLASFTTLAGELRDLGAAAPTPPLRPLFDAVEREAGGAQPSARRLALAGAAVLVLGVGLFSPAGQAFVGGAAGVARRVVQPAPQISYAGDRALFHAQAGDAVVYQTRRYSLLTASADGATTTPLGSTLVEGGSVWSLAGGKVLYDAGRNGSHRWTVADANGAHPTPLANAGDRDVLDVTPDGTRILLRRASPNGGYATAPGSTEVLDASGNLVWSDVQAAGADGVDARSIAADGSAVLSGDTGFVRVYPLDGGPATQLPGPVADIGDPQRAKDGAIAFAATALDGPNQGATTVYYYRPGSAPGVPIGDAYPHGSAPLFALSPDGSLLAVWGRRPGSTLTIWGIGGAAAGKVYQTTQLGGATVTALRWSADSRALLVSDVAGDGSNAALVVRPAPDLSAAQFNPLDQGTNVVAANWRVDGGLLLLGDGNTPSGLIAVGATGASRPLLAGSDTGQTVVYGSGSAALLSADRSPTLLALRGSPPAALPVGVTALSWSPDGRQAAVVVGGSVYLYDTKAGLGAKPLAAGTSALWSPQADRILVVGADGSASVIDAAGKVLDHAPEGLDGATLTWAPSGETLAGVRHTGGADQIVTWNVGNGAVATVANADGAARVAWSPDGHSLAFGARGVSGPALFVVSARGGTPRLIAGLAAANDDFVWQAGGRAVLLIARDAPGQPGELMAARADGAGVAALGLPSVMRIFPGPR